MRRIAVALGVLTVLVLAGPGRAELCEKCKGKMFIMSVGKCVECGGFTGSGAFKLCKKCSAKLGQCEHCRAPLKAAKPALPAGRRQAVEKPAPTTPKPAKIDWRKSGTYTTGKWKYEYTYISGGPGKGRFIRYALLFYDGKPVARIAGAKEGDRIKTPWGMMQYFGRVPKEDHRTRVDCWLRARHSKGRLLPSLAESAPKPVKIDTKKDGTYTSGKWKYEYTVRAGGKPRKPREWRTGLLTYGGKPIAGVRMWDRIKTPWGTMQYYQPYHRKSYFQNSYLRRWMLEMPGGGPINPAKGWLLPSPALRYLRALELDASAGGKTVSAIVGQRIVIRLKTDGHRMWRLGKVEGDAIKQIGGAEYIRGPGVEVGHFGPGKFAFAFGAVKPGTAKLALEYRRPKVVPTGPRRGEGTVRGPANKTFTLTVTVKPAPVKPKPKPVRIDTKKSGTYTSGKWKYVYVISGAGSRKEARGGTLTYDGKPIAGAKRWDRIRTPWGLMQYFGLWQDRWHRGQWGGWLIRGTLDTPLDLTKGRLLPTPEKSTPKPAKIDTKKSGTYTSGKWKYQYTIRAVGSKSERRFSGLTYDGNLIAGAKMFDRIKTPWGMMQYYQMSYVRGWMLELTGGTPINPKKGRLLPSPEKAASSGLAPLKLDDSANGKTVSAVVGQEIIIRLKGNVTTGYSWVVGKIEGDALGQVGKVKYVSDQPPRLVPGRGRRLIRHRVGGGGKYVFTFTAKKAGTAKLTLEYKRGWEKDKPAAGTFTLTVAVKANPAVTQPAAGWGKPVRGIAARVVLDRPTFKLGEPPVVTFELKKATKDAVLPKRIRMSSLGFQFGRRGSLHGAGKVIPVKDVGIGEVFFRTRIDLKRKWQFFPWINADGGKITVGYCPGPLTPSGAPVWINSAPVSIRVDVPDLKALDEYVAGLRKKMQEAERRRKPIPPALEYARSLIRVAGIPPAGLKDNPEDFLGRMHEKPAVMFNHYRQDVGYLYGRRVALKHIKAGRRVKYVPSNRWGGVPMRWKNVHFIIGFQGGYKDTFAADKTPTANGNDDKPATKKEKLKAATVLLEKALVSDPDNPSILRSLGATYSLLGEEEKAFKTFQKATLKDKGCGLILAGKGAKIPDSPYVFHGGLSHRRIGEQGNEYTCENHFPKGLEKNNKLLPKTYFRITKKNKAGEIEWGKDYKIQNEGGYPYTCMGLLKDRKGNIYAVIHAFQSPDYAGADLYRVNKKSGKLIFLLHGGPEMAFGSGNTLFVVENANRGDDKIYMYDLGLAKAKKRKDIFAASYFKLTPHNSYIGRISFLREDGKEYLLVEDKDMWEDGKSRGILKFEVKKPDPTAERVKKLKASIDSFILALRYHGPQDKPLYRSVVLSVPRADVKAMPGFDHYTISEKQAEKIIDHLADDGFLGKALDVTNAKIDPPGGPFYSMQVNVGKMRLYKHLGWDLKMLERLDGLQKVLDGDAAKAMNKLLKPLERHRKKWENAQGVKGKAVKLTGNFMPGIGGPPGGRRTPMSVPVWVFKGKVKPFRKPDRKHPALVKVVRSGKDGTYRAALPPGEYTIVSKTGGRLYLNSYDGVGYWSTVMIEKGRWTEFDIKDSSGATF